MNKNDPELTHKLTEEIRRWIIFAKGIHLPSKKWILYCFTMSTITLKDEPHELRVILKQRAARNRRSLNLELLFCLEQIIGLIPSPQSESRDWIESSKQ